MQHIGKEAHAGEHLTLYDRYASTILIYLERRVGHRQDSEDLLVEVFLAAFKAHNLANLDEGDHLAWLRRVAHNKVVDRLRQTRRSTYLSLDDAEAQESDELTPEEESIRRESYGHLHQLVASLSPIQQTVLRLRYGEGLRLVEIAARLQKSDGTIRKLLLRTLRRLHKLYEREERIHQL